MHGNNKNLPDQQRNRCKIPQHIVRRFLQQLEGPCRSTSKICPRAGSRKTFRTTNTFSVYFKEIDSMYENKLRKLYQSKKLGGGMLIGLPTPVIVDMMGCAGLSYVTLDTEHCSYDLAVLENMASAADARGIATLVRFYGPDPYMIAKVLDIGVDGLKFSKVETKEEAETIVRYCRLPPHGERSPEPSTRSAGYGTFPREEYNRLANDTVVVVGIDTKKGLENVDAIVSVPGVDAVSVGPSDMSWSLGVSKDSPEYLDAVKRIHRSTQAAGKTSIGIVYSPDQIGEWLQRDPNIRVYQWAADRMNITRFLQEGINRANAVAAKYIGG